MTWNYAQQSIEQALEKAKGNAAQAARAIMALAATDARLMNELAGPHLRGIVAHAVAHVVKAQKNQGEAKVPRASAPEHLDMPLDQFGRELLGALSGRDTPQFGREVYGAAGAAPKQASQAHVDVIKKIAKTDTRRE